MSKWLFDVKGLRSHGRTTVMALSVKLGVGLLSVMRAKLWTSDFARRWCRWVSKYQRTRRPFFFFFDESLLRQFPATARPSGVEAWSDLVTGSKEHLYDVTMWPVVARLARRWLNMWKHGVLFFSGRALRGRILTVLDFDGRGRSWTWRGKYGLRFDSLGLVGHDQRWPDKPLENGRKNLQNRLKGKFSSPRLRWQFWPAGKG